MSQLMAREFLALSQQDAGVRALLTSVRSVDEVLKIASARGFKFSESDFNAASYEFDDDSKLDEVELESLTKVGRIDPTYCGRSCSQRSTRSVA